MTTLYENGFEWIETTTWQELADNTRTFIKGRAIENTDLYKNVAERIISRLPDGTIAVNLRNAVPPQDQ